MNLTAQELAELVGQAARRQPDWDPDRLYTRDAAIACLVDLGLSGPDTAAFVDQYSSQLQVTLRHQAEVRRGVITALSVGAALAVDFAITEPPGFPIARCSYLVAAGVLALLTVAAFIIHKRKTPRFATLAAQEAGLFRR
jgi:hypothetical protein